MIKNHFSKINLKLDLKNYFSNKDINKILYFMLKDKKNISEKINLILLRKIGQISLDKKYSSKILSNFFKNELFN